MMLLGELRRILQNRELSDDERCCKLQEQIASLYKQIDPDDESSVDIDFEYILELKEYLVLNRDENVLNELLALLRNVVPFNASLRAKLCDSDLNETLADMVFESSLTRDEDPEGLIACHRFLQYIANFVAVDETKSEYFFRLLILSEKRTVALRRILSCRNEKLCRVAVNVFIRMMQNESNWLDFLESEGLFVDVIEMLIKEVLNASDSDAFGLLKRTVTAPSLFSVYFDRLDLRSQGFLLDLVAEQLTEVSTEVPVLRLPDESLQFCIGKVKDHIEKLPKQPEQNSKRTGEVLFIKFITVLALSSLEDPRGTIGNDLELLIMSIECLRTVHVLGKTETHGFEPKTDFDSLAGNEGEIFEHPLFGLKRDLVRLIGNMCHKNKRNQETIRDFNGIELLCDMSSLDARNPFITQWVVLALKNLMDGNEENQTIVASLTRKTHS